MLCRSLLRRYPDFDDPRAALAAAEWELGQYERAEGDWNRVQDPRYADKEWLLKTRRWPAKLCEALQAFLEIRMTKKTSSAARYLRLQRHDVWAMSQRFTPLEHV